MSHRTVDRFKAYAGFIKLEHAVFSLPLVLSGALLQDRRWPSWSLLGWMFGAAAAARVVAMGLNRIIDAGLDARNPRTAQRELPRGAMRHREAWGVVLVAGAVYLGSAAAIAPVCAWLSPIPVALFVIYPYLKRLTVLAHVGLGLAWSMGPVGGWLAAAKSLDRLHEISWLWLFSVLWVSGFDIIYATMDEAFDRQAGLRSLPVRLGSRHALRIAAVLHAGAWVLLGILWYKQLGHDQALWWLAAIGGLFIWQHAIAPRRPAFAFFQLNAVLGFLVLAFVASAI